MKYICQYGNLADEGNHWCRNCDRDCQPNALSLIFDRGEKIDELEVLNRLCIFPSATLYQAKQGNQKVLLKVANVGYEETLKTEVRLLARTNHPALPILLPSALGQTRPYGKTTIRNETKYYAVYKNLEGRLLREVLQETLQPSAQYVVWLTLGVADVLAYLHIKHDNLLLNISPDNILIRLDRNGIPRPYLLDFGSLTNNQTSPLLSITSPAYMSPEQVRGEKGDTRSNVYNLGLLLYEMLSGQPAVSTKLRSDAELREIVRTQRPIPLNRPELKQGLIGIVEQALQKEPSGRQPDVRSFAKGLRVLFGEIPVEKTGMFSNRKTIAIAIVILIVALMAILITVLVQNLA